MQYFQRKNQNRVKKEHPLQKQPVQRNHAYRLAVIVPAMNEEDTLGAVLDEINRLMPDELIVVVNGSKDQTAAVASEKGAKVIQFHYPLGNDVGRAIGAEAANADIYLFTDADIVIQAEQYIPFIVAIENGEDLSLNSIDWITHFDKADTISAGRYFFKSHPGSKRPSSRKSLNHSTYNEPSLNSRNRRFCIGKSDACQQYGFTENKERNSPFYN